MVFEWGRGVAGRELRSGSSVPVGALSSKHGALASVTALPQTVSGPVTETFREAQAARLGAIAENYGSEKILKP